MPSDVDIGNQALATIGSRSTIQSLDENSNEAVAVRQQYDSTRLQLIRMAPWQFCERYATLTLLKAAPGTPENPTNTTGSGVWISAWPPPPWSYSYLYPPDCVFAKYMLPNNIAGVPGTPIFSGQNNYYPGYWWGQRYIKFKKSSDVNAQGNPCSVLLTNLTQAILCYNYDAQNPNLFDDDFIIAFINALGSNICAQLTGDKAREQMLVQEANRVIQEARVRDGNEGPVVNDVTPDWLRIRGVGDGSTLIDYNGSVDYGPLWGAFPS